MARFDELEARELPTLACIGRVTKIEEPKATKVNEHGINYLMIPIHIEGYGASRGTKVNFMFRPEWLKEGFRSRDLAKVEGGKGLLAVYGNNISQKGKVSTLKGLVGSVDEEFDALADTLLTLSPGEEVPTGEQVASALQKVLIDEEKGQRIGYVLRQQREKTEDVDPDTGKPIYVLTPYYEVNEFYTPNEKGRKRQYNRAERTPDTFKVQFTEDDVPF
jgi:hypothetical protein